MSWVAVHGRTKEQRADPVNYEAIKLVKENLTVPVLANGDIFNSADVTRICQLTGANGVYISKYGNYRTNSVQQNLQNA